MCCIGLHLCGVRNSAQRQLKSGCNSSVTHSLIDRVGRRSCRGRGRRGRSDRGSHRGATSGAPLGGEYIDVLGNRRLPRLPSNCAGRRSVGRPEYRRISCLSPFIKSDVFLDRLLQFIEFRRCLSTNRTPNVWSTVHYTQACSIKIGVSSEPSSDRSLPLHANLPRSRLVT